MEEKIVHVPSFKKIKMHTLKVFIILLHIALMFVSMTNINNYLHSRSRDAGSLF